MIHRDAIEIRAAVEDDAAAINDIYNHYVLHSTCTYHGLKFGTWLDLVYLQKLLYHGLPTFPTRADGAAENKT